MFTVCVGLVFRSNYMKFLIICSLQYSININTVEIDPHSDLLHICIVKPKNSNELSPILDYRGYACHVTSGVSQDFYFDSE